MFKTEKGREPHKYNETNLAKIILNIVMLPNCRNGSENRNGSEVRNASKFRNGYEF